MAMISESACRAQLRHHDRQDVVTYSALLIHVLPNSGLSGGATITTRAVRSKPVILMQGGASGDVPQVEGTQLNHLKGEVDQNLQCLS